jgi:uncharacterized protein
MNFLFLIAKETWLTVEAMAPYLLGGFAVAGLLSAFVSQKTVEKHLGGRGFWPVFKASMVGVPLPLCSCGVIPVAASLRKHGSSRGATTSFLISTPQTGVDSILVTYSLLGPVFAIFRPLVAFVTGILGGMLTDTIAGGAEHGDSAAPACEDSCCCGHKRQPWYAKAFRFGFVTLPRDIAGSMLIGMVVAGVISALIPDDFFAARLGAGVLGIFVMMLLGIPIYVCATASVPIAAALIAKGISPGAALAFLITGPATNATTIVTLWKMLGPRSVFVYLATIAVAAFASGLLLNSVFSMPNIPPPCTHHAMGGSWLSLFWALLLIGVLISGLFKPRKTAAS